MATQQQTDASIAARERALAAREARLAATEAAYTPALHAEAMKVGMCTYTLLATTESFAINVDDKFYQFQNFRLTVTDRKLADTIVARYEGVRYEQAV